VTSAAATKIGRPNRGLRKIDRLKTGLHNKNHPTTARQEIAHQETGLPIIGLPVTGHQITDRPVTVPLATSLPETDRLAIDRQGTGPLETALELDRRALDSRDVLRSQVDREGRIDRPSCRPIGQSRRTL